MHKALGSIPYCVKVCVVTELHPSSQEVEAGAEGQPQATLKRQRQTRKPQTIQEKKQKELQLQLNSLHPEEPRKHSSPSDVTCGTLVCSAQ